MHAIIRNAAGMLLDANWMFQSFPRAATSATAIECCEMQSRLAANLIERRLDKKGRAWLARTRGCEFAALRLWMSEVRPDCFDPKPSRVRFRMQIG